MNHYTVSIGPIGPRARVFDVLAAKVHTAVARALETVTLNAPGLTLTITVVCNGRPPKCLNGRYIIPGNTCRCWKCLVDAKAKAEASVVTT